MRRDSVRFYIASQIDNLAAVRALSTLLRDAGFQHTYDWSVHGRCYNPDAPENENNATMGDVAEAELQGVIRADVVIVLLPGGRGTHIEIGAALAHRKQVFIVGSNDPLTGTLPDGRYPCVFYRHSSVKHFANVEAVFNYIAGEK